MRKLPTILILSAASLGLNACSNVPAQNDVGISDSTSSEHVVTALPQQSSTAKTKRTTTKIVEPEKTWVPHSTENHSPDAATPC